MRTPMMLVAWLGMVACAGPPDHLENLGAIEPEGPGTGVRLGYTGGASANDFWVLTESRVMHSSGEAPTEVTIPAELMSGYEFVASSERLWATRSGNPPHVVSISSSGEVQDHAAALGDSLTARTYARGDTVAIVLLPTNEVLLFTDGTFVSIGAPPELTEGYDITRIMLLSDSDIYAVSATTAAHYDGATWQTLPDFTLPDGLGPLGAVDDGEAWFVVGAASVTQPNVSITEDEVGATDWTLAHLEDGTLTTMPQPIPTAWRTPNSSVYYNGLSQVAVADGKPALIAGRREFHVPDNRISMVANKLVGDTLGDDIHLVLIDDGCGGPECDTTRGAGVFDDGSVYVYREVHAPTGIGVLLYAGRVD